MAKFYTYKVTFPGFKWYYYGYHKDNGKPYYGSPITHKWIWECYEHEIQILERFSTRDEAISLEKRLIKPFLNDPFCLNEHCGGHFGEAALQKSVETRKRTGASLFTAEQNPATFETCSQGGKLGGALPWWNNGVQNARSHEPPGENWVRGRIVTWKWFNDGNKNIRSKECPEGFVRGRVMRRDSEGKFLS